MLNQSCGFPVGILDINLPRLKHHLDIYIDQGWPRSPNRDGLSFPQPRSASFKLHGFATVSSTNEILWGLIDQGWKEGTVAIARQQETGRGQWGRTWQSLPGGLYLSLALTPNSPATHSSQLTLCTCWGIVTALRTHGIPVGIKWPNDLVVQRRKLGGILLETRLQKGSIYRAVVGVGMNWANEVPVTGINLQTVQGSALADPLAKSWIELSPINSLEQLAAIALHGIMMGYQCWQQHGIEAILPSYQALLTNIGQAVTLEDGCSGTVVGVSSAGELRVQVSSMGRASPTKDIFLLPGMVSLGYGDSGTE